MEQTESNSRVSANSRYPALSSLLSEQHVESVPIIRKLAEDLPIRDRLFVNRMRRMLEYCHASGAKTEKDLLERGVFSPEDIQVAVFSAKPFAPAHFIAIDATQQAIVLAIRGSKDSSDLVTDLTFTMTSPSTESKGRVHAGMQRAAVTLFNQTFSTIFSLSEAFPEYQIVVTGHSLGAGVAALYAREFAEATHSEAEKFDVVAWCFAPPAIVSVPMISGVKCISVVNRQDPLPHVSPGAPLRHLLENVLVRGLLLGRTGSQKKQEESEDDDDDDDDDDDGEDLVPTAILYPDLSAESGQSTCSPPDTKDAPLVKSAEMFTIPGHILHFCNDSDNDKDSANVDSISLRVADHSHFTHGSSGGAAQGTAFRISHHKITSHFASIDAYLKRLIS